MRSFNGNKYGYQGSEKNQELGANDYYTHFRGLDVEVGRWKGVDPVYQASESPYVSMGNNPVMFNDVLGNDIDYGSRKQKRDIKYLRKHDAAYNKWWNDNAAQYDNNNHSRNLVVNVVTGRNDLKHSELQSERYSDGKETGNAYLYYDGTLNHREISLVKYRETRRAEEVSSPAGSQSTIEFSYNLKSTISNFKKWEVKLEEGDSGGQFPSGSFSNANLSSTIYSGSLKAVSTSSYDRYTGIRTDHAGFSRASFIFSEISNPIYYNETLTTEGWGNRMKIPFQSLREKTEVRERD